MVNFSMERCFGQSCSLYFKELINDVSSDKKGDFYFTLQVTEITIMSIKFIEIFILSKCKHFK